MPKYRIQTPDGKTLLYDVPDGVTAAQALAHAQQNYKPPMTSATRKTPAVPVQTRQQGVQQAARNAQPAQDGGFFSGLKDFAASAEAGASKALYGIPDRVKAALDYYGPKVGVTPQMAQQGYGTENFGKGKSYQDQLALERAATNQQANRSVAGNVLGTVASSIASGSAEAAGLKAAGARLAASSGKVARGAGNVLQALTDFKRGQPVRNVGRAAVVGGATGAAQAAGQGESPTVGAVAGAATAGTLQGLGTAAKKFLVQPAADILGLSNAGSYLKRFTNATTAQMQQRLDAFRQQTGAEPTLFELLPLADRNKLISNTVAGRDPIVDQVSNAIKARGANVGPEMQDVVNAATGPQKILTQRQMVRDLATARGGANSQPVGDRGDAALAYRASNSPTDMQTFRRTEANLIMAPHDNAPVVDNLDDLLPQHPVANTAPARQVPVTNPETGQPLLDQNNQPVMRTIPGQTTYSMTESDPEVSAAIRSVSGSLRRRLQDGQPITVQDVTNMISDLGDDAAKGGIDGRNAANAIDHLTGVLQQNVPDAADAAARMRQAFAARSRMIEGMQAGNKGALRDDIQVGTNQRQGQLVRNAFDSEEGVAGRQVGQTNALNSDLSTTPNKALATTIDIARGGQPALAENLGQNAADQISQAAGAQANSAEALTSAMRSAQSGQGNALSPEDLAGGLLALSPHTFATTKAKFIKNLANHVFLPENKASQLADMLFSQDPRQTQLAVNLLNRTDQGKGLLQSLNIGNIVAPQLAPDASPQPELQQGSAPTETLGIPPQTDDSQQGSAPPQEPQSVTPASGYTLMSAPGPVDPSQSQYMPALQHIYDNDDPQFLDFVNKHQQQESGGKQFGKDGQPIRSKAGAVGIMQLMPATAKEAAARAGVPYDPIALEYDPAYNKLLGTVHVAHLLNKYGGDTQKASAAYNAGEGAVDRALDANGNLVMGALPAETQGYVPNVAG